MYILDLFVILARVYFRFIHRLMSCIFFRFGTMHVVATNLNLWIRTLFRESLYEIYELCHHPNDVIFVQFKSFFIKEHLFPEEVELFSVYNSQFRH